MRAFVVVACLLAALAVAVPVQASASRDDPYPKCLPCLAVAELVGPLVRANTSRAIIYDLAIYACEILKPDCTTTAGCKELCIGVVNEYADEVIDIVLRTFLSPPEVCYALKLCPAPPPPPKPSGNVPVPSNCSDHTGERQWPAWSLSGKGYFVQLSDIHIDPKYTPGKTTQCGEPLCCREGNAPGNTTNTTAGVFGDYLCDTPPMVVESLFQHLASLNPPPDFVLYTGDDVPHDIWMQSRQWNLLNVAKINALFNQYLPNVPVFSAVGNHEAFPVNQFQVAPLDSWLYDQLAAGWSHYLPQDAIAPLRYGGYYTARVRPGLRVISLNTNFYADDNFWLVANNTDYSSQLLWLEDVLKQATVLKERVIIIGHGTGSSWVEKFGLEFGALIEKYRAIIMDQFFGHAHNTDTRIYRDNATDTRPISTAYVVGSVVPFQNFNPGWRKYYYDREPLTDWLVQDYDQFWMDLRDANTVGAIKDWGTVRLSAKSYFGLPDLSPKSWQAFFERMFTDDTQFKHYVHQYFRGAEWLQKRAPNRNVMACDALSTTDTQFSHCMNPRMPNGAVVSELMMKEHHERQDTGC